MKSSISSYIQKGIIQTILFFFLAISVASADEYRRMGRSYRSLAMGGTGIASASDTSALFYNAAAMANAKHFTMEIPAVQLEWTEAASDLYKDLSGGGIKLDTQSEKQDFLDKYIGKDVHARGNINFINLIVPLNQMGVAVGGGYIRELTLDFHPRNPVSPTMDFYYSDDLIQQGGLSIPLFDGQIVFGVGVRNVTRKLLDFEYGVNDVINNTEFPSLGDAESGSGIGYDFGILYRLPWKLKPSIGLVIQNANDLDLGDAGKIKQEISAGVSLSPDFGPFHLVLALDVRDMTFEHGSEGDRSLNRRLHLGGELGFIETSDGRNLITVRGGYNQTYLTYGLEVNLFAVTFGYTRYSEEIGEYAGQRESARKVFYFSAGW